MYIVSSIFEGNGLLYEGIYEGLGLFSKDRYLWMYVMEMMSLLIVIIVNYFFIIGVFVFWLFEVERGRLWFMREILF